MFKEEKTNIEERIIEAISGVVLLWVGFMLLPIMFAIAAEDFSLFLISIPITFVCSLMISAFIEVTR